MSRLVGYVVVEYNQASLIPDLAWDAPELYTNVEDARNKCTVLTGKTRYVGRGERFAIGAVILEEEDDL